MTPTPPTVIAEIAQLFAAHGALAYGESVTQMEHALQCGALAEQAGADDALITAALLHDVGHMLHRDAAGALAAGIDDAHETLGATSLARWFGADVVEPIALHVAAKRYLCANEPGYFERLSPASRRSLALQGGPMSAAEALAFTAQAHAAAAVRLRRWDDEGKRPELPTPPLAHFLAIAERCLKAAGPFPPSPPG